MSFDRKVIEAYLPRRQGVANVAHYTHLKTLLDVLGAGGIQSLWATGLRFLNDRKEMTHGLSVLRKFASPGLTTIFEQLENAPDIYQVSFSGAPDELGQCRGYANNGFGCSIVASRKDVKRSASIAGWVIYDGPAQEQFAISILEEMSNIGLRPGDDELSMYLLAAASFMKNDGFKPEQEYRLLLIPGEGEAFQMRATGDRLAPYIDVFEPKSRDVMPEQKLRRPPKPIPLQKILLGPGWQLSELDREAFLRHHITMGVYRQLERFGMKELDLAPSSIPYDPR